MNPEQQHDTGKREPLLFCAAYHCAEPIRKKRNKHGACNKHAKAVCALEYDFSVRDLRQAEQIPEILLYIFYVELPRINAHELGEIIVPEFGNAPEPCIIKRHIRYCNAACGNNGGDMRAYHFRGRHVLLTRLVCAVQQKQYYGYINDLKRTAADGARPQRKRYSRPPADGVKKRRHRKREREVLGYKPHPCVYGGKKPVGAGRNKQRRHKRKFFVLYKFSREPVCKHGAEHRGNECNRPVAREQPQGDKRQHNIRRKRRKAYKIFAVVYRKLKIFIVLSEVEPPFKPRLRLKDI